MKNHLAKGFITALLVAVLMAAFAVSASAATTYNVETKDQLVEAVEKAVDGDEIIVQNTIEITEPLTFAEKGAAAKITVKSKPPEKPVVIKAADS